jgi:hypothetical protein
MNFKFKQGIFCSIACFIILAITILFNLGFNFNPRDIIFPLKVTSLLSLVSFILGAIL